MTSLIVLHAVSSSGTLSRSEAIQAYHSPDVCQTSGPSWALRSAARGDGARADLGVSRGTREQRSHPPEEVGRRDSPPAVVVLEVVAETDGLPVREIVPADHVRRRRMPPGKASHLQDYATGAGRAVDHPVAAGHLAVWEWLDPGGQTPLAAQHGPTGIPPLPRHKITEGVRCVCEWLPQLALEDGFADRLLQALVRGYVRDTGKNQSQEHR